ncbi:MAG: hypothetical protein IKF08_03980 [Lactococcus sp.]|nr:hypothetical protein [Lactococcus sp.]
MSQGNKLPYLEEVERNLEEVFSNFKYLYHQNMTDEPALNQLRQRTLHQIWHYRETDYNSSFYVPYELKKRYSDKVKNYLF